MSDDLCPKTSKFVPSLDMLSAVLGTTERQWRTYAKRPGFPQKVEGKGYDLAAIAAWKAANVAPRGDSTLAAKKLEKLEEEIALLKLKRAKEERTVVPIASVDELHGRMALRLRAYLYAKLENEMPPKLAGCDALTMRQMGSQMADEIVGTLAKDIDAWKA